MPIDTEGLDHNRECPKCEGALDEGVGYNLCPHCGHSLSKTSARTTQWQCPECGNWDYEGMNPGGRGPGWHDCKSCGWRESGPTDVARRHSPSDWDEDEQGQYDYDEWYDAKGNPHPSTMEEPHPDMYPEDAPHDQLDDPWNAPRLAKFQVVSMGEMQQPGGVGATQTTGLTDGEGIEHPDDHSDMADAGKNSFEQNVALETWVNFAVDMLNRGKTEQEVSAQLSHDGCPEPQAVLQRALEQPQQDPVGNDGAADPFETPPPADPTGTMESVHQQPPVLSHWLESPEDKAAPGQQVRIAGTSWRGIELDRWEDLYGQQMAKVALNDGGIITVAAETVEPDGDRKIQDPTTEIQNFIDGLPEVEPTRPSIIARIANLKMARMAVRQHISKVSFSDQVKLERLDRRAEDEVRELTDFLGRMASDADMQYIREQQRYRAAGQHNREVVTNAAFNSRIPEKAAIFVSELAPEVRADKQQIAYAAAHFASQNNGDFQAFVKAAISWSDNRGTFAESPNQRDPGEVDGGWPVRGTGDFPVDMKRDDWITCPNCKGEDFTPDGQCMGCGQRLAKTASDPGYAWSGSGGAGSDREMGDDTCPHCHADWDQPHAEGCPNSDAEYWSAREHGSHPDYAPEEDPFAIWPGGHPMDR